MVTPSMLVSSFVELMAHGQGYEGFDKVVAAIDARDQRWRAKVDAAFNAGLALGNERADERERAGRAEKTGTTNAMCLCGHSAAVHFHSKPIPCDECHCDDYVQVANV